MGMNKIIYRTCTLSLALAMAASSFVWSGAAVYAADTITVMNGAADAQLGGNGSLTITGNEGQSLNGKKFELFRLFDSKTSADGTSISYSFNETYQAVLQSVVFEALKTSGDLTSDETKSSDITQERVVYFLSSLENDNGRSAQFRYFAESIRTAIKDAGLSGEMIEVGSSSDENSITLSNLPFGYYMVDEISDSAADSEDADWFASSLLLIDTVSPTAQLHIKSDYPTVEKKIREDDNRSVIGNDGWNDIGDYEIGQVIPYTLTGSVPDMDGMDTYFYAFHDRCDAEILPYLKTSNDTATSREALRVSVTGKDASGKEKTYELTEDEFVIETKQTTHPHLDDGDSFVVVISDLKAIADREFAGGSASKVQVRFDAILSDEAASKTGRGGFENDIRLEFSNDYDSDGKGRTGYTPWDTVVAFTYRLDTLKTDTDNQVLGGAKFRLYRDEALKQEVRVTEGEDGSYLVQSEAESGVEMISSEDGSVRISGLDQGIYYLKETQAPDGYRVLTQPIKLVITPTFTAERNSYIKGDGKTDKTLQKLEATAGLIAFVKGKEAVQETALETQAEAGSIALQVQNEAGLNLPITGSSLMLIFVTAGAGLLVAAALLTYNRKRDEA